MLVSSAPCAPAVAELSSACMSAIDSAVLLVSPMLLLLLLKEEPFEQL
jgi:hypothetical protein